MCELIINDQTNRVEDKKGMRDIPSVRPPIKIMELEESFELLVPMPGIDPAKASVEIDSDILSIQASRIVNTGEPWKVTHQEFSSCFFQKKISLPANVDQSRIEVFYQDGVLKLVLLKNSPQKQQVPIQIN